LLATVAVVAATACSGSTTGDGVLDPWASTGGAGEAPGAAGSAGAAGAVEGRCGQVDPALAEADAAELFAAPRVPTFDFYLPPATWDELQAHAEDEVYAEVEGCFEGRGLGHVGLRFKGSYGSLYECAGSLGEGECRKLSLKVKFDEYAPDQRFSA
jgi:hypothetical protein